MTAGPGTPSKRKQSSPATTLDSKRRRSSDGRVPSRLQREIELEGDDPDAVEVMLRYLYNFPFPTLMANKREKDRDTCELEINVVVVGQKYMLNELADLGLDAMRNALGQAEAAFKMTHDANYIHKIWQFFYKNRDVHPRIKDTMHEIGARHYSTLFQFSPFRQALEADGSEQVLQLVSKAVEVGHEVQLDTYKKGEEHTMFHCLSCDEKWLKRRDLDSTICSRCGPRFEVQVEVQVVRLQTLS